MSVYADSSFFVSIYLEDIHSTAADTLMDSSPQVCFTPLHYAEWTHAIAQQVFHRKISEVDAERIYRHMTADRAAGVWAETPMPEMVYDVCAELARRHGLRFGVRTLDSLHVASALQLKAEKFWTFDNKQAKLAKAAGLKTS